MNTTTADPLSTAIATLEPDSAVAIRAAFEGMFAKTEEWAARAKTIVVTSEDQTREMKLARESRLALREIRINAEKTRRKLKEDSLRRGKAIDGIANVIKALIVPIEEHLKEQETFGERAQDARAAARCESRIVELQAIGADPTVYADLGAMSDETWGLTLGAAKDAFEARLEAARQEKAVRVEAERIATEKRAAAKKEAARAEAERAERERAQAAENDRLRKEAEANERALAEEREQVAAERESERERVQAENDKREKAHAAEQAKRDKAERVKGAKLRKERAAAQLVADELDAKKAAEAEALAKEQAAAKRAAAAPDRDKLLQFSIRLPEPSLLNMTTPEGEAIAEELDARMRRLGEWLHDAATGLGA